LIDPGNLNLSISRQCELVGLSRSSFYESKSLEKDFNIQLMNLIDEEYTKHPFYGSRRMTAWLNTLGYKVNRKRIQRVMQNMGIEAIYPKPNLSKAASEHRVYPYLLRGVKMERPNHVWSTDITYIRLESGFVFLTAVIDWFSRYVLSWRLSNTLDVDFCLEALDEALGFGRPEIFNTDQGSQYTSKAFTGALSKQNIAISMDGKGRALDNIFIERLWRSVKYEEVYPKNYQSASDAYCNLDNYFTFYNNERLHQALAYKSPAQVYNKL